ncbi:MAG: DUF4340 domain-containing protein [Lachnospiraceae bacterium]|nr:DUF4340 domain-containing protein [Lachnospiraceae bacterium]
MNVSRKTLAVLLILFVVFTAGTIWVRHSEKKEAPQAPEVAYYLTAFDSAEDVLAVVVENGTGSLTIVHSGDAWFTDTSLPGIEPDHDAVTELFSAVSRIRMNGRVEGANASDPQFGLTSPAATIFVEDQSENGVQFLVGDLTPDGKAYYVCASGGSEVFTLNAGYGQAFLGDVTQYLDLGVLAGTDPAKLTRILVSDAEGIRFSLKATGTGNVTGMKYYSLEQPVVIPLAAALFRENILSPMEEMRAETVSASPDPVSEEDAVKVLTLESEDGSTGTYLIRETTEGLMAVTDAGTGAVYMVPQEQLSWMDADAARLLGGKLLSLNAGETDQIVLEADGKRVVYDLSGSGQNLRVRADGLDVDNADFYAKILDSLNRITIQGIQEKDRTVGGEVLRCTILTGKGEEKTELVFDEVSDRKCHVSVNQTEAFECDRSSLQPLIDAAGGAL